MQKKIVVINFSNIYKEETFYQNVGAEWIDCSDISGADCFCDSEAAHEIRRRLRGVSPHGLHFIDSGNYHYVRASSPTRSTGGLCSSSSTTIPTCSRPCSIRYSRAATG